MELSRVKAVVTGGTLGLGAGVARALVDRGAEVCLLARSKDRGFDAVQALGPRATFTPGDVRSTDEVDAALHQAVARFGEINVLVTCAGADGAMRAVGRNGPARLEHFTRVVDVNLVGTFNCVSLAANLMATNAPGPDGERGVIVATSSIAAFDGQLGQAAYAASKAGIVGMTLPLAREFAVLGIRMTTIAPGLFETPMLAKLPGPLRETLREQLLFPARFGRPTEFASLVLHVIENTMLTGETIRLDGGLRMRGR